MRVLLIRTNPPGLGLKGLVPPGLSPPLALLLLSAMLRRRLPGVEVRIVDAGIALREHSDLVPLLHDFTPDLVGLSGLSLESFHVREISRIVKEEQPHATVILGGPVANAHPLGVLQHIPFLDASAFGEGEETIVEVVQCLQDGREITGVPGLVVRQPDGSLASSRPRSSIRDLESLPPPDWGEIELEPYNHTLNWAHVPLDPGGCVPLFTSRGCPYGCIYCHKFFGKKVRAISPAAVVDEMERVNRTWGIRDFHIIDDIFNYRKGRIIEFCRELQRRKLDVRYALPNGLRGDRIEPDEVDALADSGLYYLALAVETVTPRLQTLIGKKLDVDRVLSVASRITGKGVLTRAYAMLGFPTETADEMQDTATTLRESDFHLALFFTATPYPGTPFFDVAVEHGFDPSCWVESAFAYDRDFVNVSAVGDDEFREIFRNARRDFYEHAPRIARLRRWMDDGGYTHHPYMHAIPPWTTVLMKTGYRSPG